MNNLLKSLLTTLLLGVTLLAPVFAQDIQSGLKDLEAERLISAGEIFNKLATAAPTAENQFYLGYYYLRAGQPDQAKAAFDKGAAADPKNLLNAVGLGGVALAKKDRAGAKAAIDNAVTVTKAKNQEVLMRAAEMYTLFETNDPAEALRLIDLADKLDKKNVSADIEMIYGDAYNIKNDGGNAVSKYENALMISPNLAKANYKIGRVFLRGKNYPNAQTYFETAIKDDADFAPTYKAFADALANSRAYKKAALMYDKYIEVSKTNDAEQLLDVARYKYLAQDYLGAINYLEKLKGRLKNPIIDRIYGWSHYGLGRYSESVESINRFIQNAPDKVIYDDHVYLGRAYAQLGTPEGDSLSVVNLDKAAPKDTVENLYREIARKYQDAKRYDKAADYWQKSIAYDKKPSGNDYLYLGVANYVFAPRAAQAVAKEDTAQQRMVRQRYYLRADSAFAKLAILSPDYVLANYYRGQATYYSMPQAQALASGAALPFYEKYIEAVSKLDPAKQADNTRYLITVYKALAGFASFRKDDVKYKESLTKVLELDPNDKDAKTALEGPAPSTAKPVPAPTPAAKPAPAPKPPVKKTTK